MTRRRTGKVKRSPRARLDLVEIATHIADSNVDASDRFLAAAKAASEKLAAVPGTGRLRGFKNPALSDLRSWPIRGFRNYLIFYRPTRDGIEVVRVLHGARDIDQIFEGE